MGNPKKALAALLPRPVEAAPGIVVRPVTLGMFALLEQLDSPLLRPLREGEGAAAFIPSLWAITHPADAADAADIPARARAWADTVPPSVLPAVRAAFERQVAAMAGAVPELPKKKAAPTAGSRSGAGGPRGSSAGRGAKSCGGSPRRPSSPSGGKAAGRRESTT